MKKKEVGTNKQKMKGDRRHMCFVLNTPLPSTLLPLVYTYISLCLRINGVCNIIQSY